MLLYLSHIKEKTFQFFLSIPLYCPGGKFPPYPLFYCPGGNSHMPPCPGGNSHMPPCPGGNSHMPPLSWGKFPENLAYKIIIYFNKLLFNIYYI